MEQPWSAAAAKHVENEEYDPREQEEAFEALTSVLRTVLKDGGRKRAAGEKPPWWCDTSHKRAFHSHFYKYFGLNEMTDRDSGAHALAHLACRALMIAWQDLHGRVDPRTERK